MSEFSQSRLESKLMESISSLIVSGAIKNPHLSVFTSVTRVELSPDNTAARIYVSSMPEERRVVCLGWAEPPKRQAGVKLQEKEAAEAAAKAVAMMADAKVL